MSSRNGEAALDPVMGRRIQIAPHVSLDELEQRDRQTKDGVERSPYQIIWLLAQSKRTKEFLCCFCLRSLQRFSRRNAYGP